MLTPAYLGTPMYPTTKSWRFAGSRLNHSLKMNNRIFTKYIYSTKEVLMNLIVVHSFCNNPSSNHMEMH